MASSYDWINSSNTPVLTWTSGTGYGVSGDFTFDFDPNDYLRFNLKDTSTGDLWSSSQGETVADNYQDHMVTFKITSGPSPKYVICWEDLRLAQADKDYNDMVIEVSKVNPVPEPALPWLLASALVLRPCSNSRISAW